MWVRCVLAITFVVGLWFVTDMDGLGWHIAGALLLLVSSVPFVGLLVYDALSLPGDAARFVGYLTGRNEWPLDESKPLPRKKKSQPSAGVFTGQSDKPAACRKAGGS